jgi:serine/threonine protein kinase
MMHFCPNDGNALIPITSQDPFINTVLDGKYLIEEAIGKGGMGLVYRARHVNFNRQFAIKILKNELVSDPQAIKRFRNEANAAGMIRHPNAITISDFNITTDGAAYLVMDYVEGRSLRDILKKEGRQSYQRTISLISQVCDAAAAAHRKGIIHRDLKPDNIMVEKLEDDSEMVRVLDFGIAKLSQNPAYSENITVGGAILGSPYYMSPEQCDGRHLDNRSDIYSLGIILYELLVGKVPFRAQTPWGLVKMHCSAAPQPIRNYRADIPPALENAILKALAKDPKDRQQSALELRKELEASLSAATSPQVIPSEQSGPPATIEMDIKNLPELSKQYKNQQPDPLGTQPLSDPTKAQTSLEQQKLEALAKELEAEINQIRAKKDSSGLKSAPLRNTTSSAFDDLANELSNELNQFEPKATPNFASSSQFNSAELSSSALNTKVSAPYMTDHDYKASLSNYSAPTTAAHQAVNAAFSPNRSQTLSTTLEPVDIAEEFSLALPEMVEDVLMSVSESILTKSEVLSQRAAQEAALAAQAVVAEAQNRNQVSNPALNSYTPGANAFSTTQRSNLANQSGKSETPDRVTRQTPGLVDEQTKSSSEFQKQLLVIIGVSLLAIVVIWLIIHLIKG